MALDILRIEACLARDLRLYLKDRAPERRLALSSDLEHLLTGLWDSRDRWFDGVVDATYKVRKGTRIDVRGLMVWGTPGKDRRQWVDIFAADLRAVDDRVAYTLSFGRKGLENRRIPYGEPRELLRELQRPQEWEWAWEFVRPG